MITQDTRALLARASEQITRCLEAAAGFTIARSHYEVTLEHLLLKLLEDGKGDLPKILRHFGVDTGAFEGRLLATVEQFRSGNSGRPSFSPQLLDLLERALLVGVVEFGQQEVRSGTLLAAAISDRGISPFRPYLDLVAPVRLDELKRDFATIVQGSIEDRPASGRFGAGKPLEKAGGAPAPGGDASALGQYTIDLTARAAAGQIDPVWGRDDEIRQMIDILTRRRKNNPILVGEAGVGKTALVEGLALRIVAGDVPKSLQGVGLRTLDLGLLQAGAGVKGEFENRLKSVIAEIKESPIPLITFIDEAHTLIGAGGSAGGSDAANLLKPALARGELRTVAATTWSEYKKYFEKDPALARRFQLVKVDEPDEERATTMLRGVRQKFEEAHSVRILDSAVAAAVRLSERYISGRQLPDKGVDLMDTAAARVKIGLSAKPASVDDLERRIRRVELAIDSKKRDVAAGSVKEDGEIPDLEKSAEEMRSRLAELMARWEIEKGAVAKVEEARAKGEGNPDLPVAIASLAEIQKNDPMIPLEVTPDVVAAVVSDWTGIPAGKMLRDQARQALDLEKNLGERVLGQDHALRGFGERIRSSKSGLGSPETPIGVFLLVGPSGVGKTECGIGLADLLFGGDRFLVTINMSEYMEAHTVSRLIGSPPGYVGYGEGGRLTEAVRQRPYSVVLLDEVEKSHPDVMNLFYQVFDKGILNDGEGREIDFRNTVVVMTSNLSSETIVEMCSGDTRPDVDELVEAIRPKLRERFKPALLARMTIVPFYPISGDVMRKIVGLKLRKVVSRLEANGRINLTFAPAVTDWIAERCTVEETGARNVDAIIQSLVLPRISTEILTRMAEEKPIKTITVDVEGAGGIRASFD
jgi:type VI secretion system protein VasG